MSKHSTKKPGNEKVQVHKDGSKERWRDVVGYEGLYRVSDKGQVKTLDRIRWNGRAWRRMKGRILKPYKDKGSYLIVYLVKDWKKGRKAVNIAWLVLSSFIGPRPPGMEACHSPDRNPANNCLSNLRWDTPKNNQADRVTHGTDGSGERNAMAKLSKYEVRMIRVEYATGKYTQEELARENDTTQSRIGCIVRRDGWKNV